MSIGCGSKRVLRLMARHQVLNTGKRENTSEQTIYALRVGADAGARRLLRRRVVRSARRNRPELWPQPAANGVPATRGHRCGPAGQYLRLVELGYGDDRARVR